MVASAPQALYESYKGNIPNSYLLILHHGFVFDRGNIALSCGIWQQLNSCVNSFYKRNVKAWAITNKVIGTMSTSWLSLFKQTHISPYFLEKLRLLGAIENSDGPLQRVREVFVADTSWDFNYHHMVVESAPRLMRALSYLRNHPDVLIHLREEEKRVRGKGGAGQVNVNVKRHQEGVCTRGAVLGLLGLSPSRIISGPVMADTILLPHDQGCSNFLEHPLELRRLAEELTRASKTVACDSPVHKAIQKSRTTKQRKNSEKKQRIIVIHSRPCNRNSIAYIWRCFTDRALAEIGSTAEKAFVGHDVILHPHAQPRGEGVITENTSRMTTNRAGLEQKQCQDQLACSIQQYRYTDVFIALHGAAMTNVMFMQPGSLLVEIVGYFDGKMLPLCGIYGPLAAVFGVHHYVYYYDGMYDDGSGLNNSTDNLLDVEDMISNVYKYYRDVVLNNNVTMSLSAPQVKT